MCKERSIVNSVDVYKAFSNQELSVGQNVHDQLEHKRNLSGQRFHPHTNLQIAQIPIAITGFLLQNFSEQR